MSVSDTALQDMFCQLALERTGGDAQRQALVYNDLKRMARRVSGSMQLGVTLQTTALLHEAWARLAQADLSELTERRQFMGMAATVMHRIAVDHVRARSSQKRGGDRRFVAFEEAWQQAVNGEPDDLVVGLHEALTALQEVAPDLVELAQLLFFVGLTQQQVAELRDVSLSTVRRDWRRVRAWLYRYLSADGE